MRTQHRPVLFALLACSAWPASAIVGGLPTTSFGHVGVYGVQVSESWVLTARHTGWRAGGVFSNAYGSATVAAVYDAGSGGFPLDDLSLLRLESPIAAAQPLVLVGSVLPFGELAQPWDVTIASGRGGSRGYALTELYEVRDLGDPDDGGPKPALPVNWLITHGPTYSAPHVQPGDSGGALFLGHVSDSTGAALMGITSAWNIEIPVAPLTEQSTSGFVQLAAYRSWIDGTLLADGADLQAVTWLSAVPEPTTTALWLVGLGGLVVAARRRSQAPR